MSINETVLEMHFHKALLDLIRTTLGLGTGNFNFFKYSPQRECFVGFDQAFVKTDLSEDELFAQLKADAMQNGYSLTNFFLGIFLQYKVVKIMNRRVRTTPPAISNRPYYRVPLDTKKNDRTGFSQHELLFNLKGNDGALVYYTCPMIFDREELYAQNPDLSLLRLADVGACPSDYSDNESHYIYFNDTDAPPIWCSDPVEGVAISPLMLFETIKEGVVSGSLLESQLGLLEKLSHYEDTALPDHPPKSRLLDMVHESLMIFQYTEG